MTVTTEVSRATFPWTGVETSFSCGFPADQVSHLRVLFRTVAGVSSLMTLGVNYDATLAMGTKLATITPISFPAATGDVIVTRVTPAQVAEVLADGQEYSLAVIQALHDRAAMRSAEDRTRLARAIVLAEDAELGDGSFDLGGSGIDNLAPGTTPSSAATVAQIQEILAASGNVPAPVLADIGRLLVATGADTFGWVALALAMIPDGFFTADAAGLAKFQDGFWPATTGARAKFADGIWTNAKLASMANGTVKGRLSAGVGASEDLTGAQFRDGVQAAGAIVDRAYAEYLFKGTTAAIIPLDGTIPQVTEGSEILSASITPKSTTNRVRATVVVHGAVNAVADLVAALFRNGGANALRSSAITLGTAYTGVIVFTFEDVPASTSAQTYTVRAGPGQAANAYFNWNGALASYLGATGVACTLTLDEIKA